MWTCIFFILRKIFLCLFMIRCLPGNIMGFFHGIVPSVLFKHPWYLTMLLFLFLLQTQKFYINFDRSKGKGEKAPNQSNPKNNSQIPKHTDQAIYQKPKILLFCGTIFFTDVYGVTTKHKHIPCQSKWHHKSSVQRQWKAVIFARMVLSPLWDLLPSYITLAFIMFCADQKALGNPFIFSPQVPS